MTCLGTQPTSLPRLFVRPQPFPPLVSFLSAHIASSLVPLNALALFTFHLGAYWLLRFLHHYLKSILWHIVS